MHHHFFDGNGRVPPSDKQRLAPAEEGDDVASDELLLLDVLAPPLGKRIALATPPVGVPELPYLASLVVKAQRHGQPPLLGEVPLGVLLRYDQPVGLVHVAGRQRFLEHGCFQVVHDPLL